MPLGQSTAPTLTGNVRLGGNLPADAAVGTQIVTSLTVYDVQGTPIDATFTFAKTAANTWTVTATMPDQTTQAPVTVGTANLGLGPDRHAAGVQPGAGADAHARRRPPAPGRGGTIAIDFGAAGDATALRQFAGQSSVAALSQDGSALGTLQSFTIGQDGIVTGVFSNGRTRPIGQIALAAFSNPAGLEKAGNSLYRASVNSGLPQVGQAGSGGRGTLLGQHARDDERRPGPGVHQPDHRPARLPGELPGHHRFGRAAPRPRQPQALTRRRPSGRLPPEPI